VLAPPHDALSSDAYPARPRQVHRLDDHLGQIGVGDLRAFEVEQEIAALDETAIGELDPKVELDAELRTRVGLVHRGRHEGVPRFSATATSARVPSGSGSDRRKEQQRVVERSGSILQDAGGAFVERSARPVGGGDGEFNLRTARIPDADRADLSPVLRLQTFNRGEARWPTMVFDEISWIIDEEHEIDIGIASCVATGVGADQDHRLDPFLFGGPGDNLV